LRIVLLTLTVFLTASVPAAGSDTFELELRLLRYRIAVGDSFFATLVLHNPTDDTLFSPGGFVRTHIKPYPYIAVEGWEEHRVRLPMLTGETTYEITGDDGYRFISDHWPILVGGELDFRASLRPSLDTLLYAMAPDDSLTADGKLLNYWGITPLDGLGPGEYKIRAAIEVDSTYMDTWRTLDPGLRDRVLHRRLVSEEVELTVEPLSQAHIQAFIDSLLSDDEDIAGFTIHRAEIYPIPEVTETLKSITARLLDCDSLCLSKGGYHLLYFGLSALSYHRDAGALPLFEQASEMEPCQCLSSYDLNALHERGQAFLNHLTSYLEEWEWRVSSGGNKGRTR
jgi:hypothetical protein